MWENKIEDLYNELDGDFLFEDLGKSPDDWTEELKTLETKVANANRSQQNNFNLQKSAILKYLEENDVQLCKDETNAMEKTAAFQKTIEKLTADLEKLETQIKHMEGQLAEQRIYCQKLESQKKHLLSEKDKVVESLEKTRKAFDLALILYEHRLGVRVSADCADSARYHVTLLPPRGSHLTHTKRSILILNQGYQLSDGSILESSGDLMAWLAKERKNWLSS